MIQGQGFLPYFECQVYFRQWGTCTMRALNEATIKRSDRTMVADLTINGVVLSASEETGLPFRLLQEVQLTTNPWGSSPSPDY